MGDGRYVGRRPMSCHPLTGGGPNSEADQVEEEVLVDQPVGVRKERGFYVVGSRPCEGGRVPRVASQCCASSQTPYMVHVSRLNQPKQSMLDGPLPAAKD